MYWPICVREGVDEVILPIVRW